MTTAIIILATPIALGIFTALGLFIADKVQTKRSKAKLKAKQRDYDEEWKLRNTVDVYCKDALSYIHKVNFAQGVAKQREEHWQALYTRQNARRATTCERAALDKLGWNHAGNIFR